MKSINITVREYAVRMVRSDSYEQNDLEEAFKADEDFYFIFESKTGEKFYESCICGLT